VCVCVWRLGWVGLCSFLLSTQSTDNALIVCCVLCVVLLCAVMESVLLPDSSSSSAGSSSVVFQGSSAVTLSLALSQSLFQVSNDPSYTNNPIGRSLLTTTQHSLLVKGVCFLIDGSIDG